MSNTFGMESHGRHAQTPHRAPARYLIVIDSAGSSIARLFSEAREQVAEIDAGSEEVAVMTKGLVAATGEAGALAAVWDGPLEGQSAAERASAAVYTLDV